MAYDDETIDHLLTRSMYATSVMDDEGAWVLLVEVPYLPISGFMYVLYIVVWLGRAAATLVLMRGDGGCMCVRHVCHNHVSKIYW